MKPLLVLGSTGSIGTQALDVVRSQPGLFRVEGLAAGSSWQQLEAQVREFRPRFVALGDAAAAVELAPRLPRDVALLIGPDSAAELARIASYDTAVHGIVGGAGLAPSVAVLLRGKKLALANKESLVMAGSILTELAREHGGTILPVDSELCAIYQCLRGEDVGRVRRVHLTASGGPFRDLEPAELFAVTPEMALKHPNWSMGPRITVGSATLMNKALEVLEAHHLFGLAAEQIHVVIHRQSVIHSMVEFVDGSVMAQLGPPDMRGPLHFCMHDPERAPSSLVGFDLGLFRQLTFEEPDPELFPSLALGFRALERGGDSGAVLNAADEIAVKAFLARDLPFREIERVNRAVLDARGRACSTLDGVFLADREARELARSQIALHAAG
ncbi:MAG: 1-deoxy-D-xylulose-5-phosphate reductoisomerase [Planctomycetes bacterium]|nr:1-deoxy-D-xylulose-5-phosphate reductoisomerase [Planctomycetota bacterium]